VVAAQVMAGGSRLRHIMMWGSHRVTIVVSCADPRNTRVSDNLVTGSRVVRKLGAHNETTSY